MYNLSTDSRTCYNKEQNIFFSRRVTQLLEIVLPFDCRSRPEITEMHDLLFTYKVAQCIVQETTRGDISEVVLHSCCPYFEKLPPTKQPQMVTAHTSEPVSDD